MLPTVAPLVPQITRVAENERVPTLVENAVLDLVYHESTARRAKACARARLD
jgi:hypothetical protein